MSLSRRRFFGIVYAAGLALAGRKLSAAAGMLSSPPVLVGDGIADDTAAIQAMVDSRHA